MSKTRVKEGGIIELLEFDPPIRAQVQAMLAVQFTAKYMDGTDTVTFRFYADEGDTWRAITE